MVFLRIGGKLAKRAFIFSDTSTSHWTWSNSFLFSLFCNSWLAVNERLQGNVLLISCLLYLLVLYILHRSHLLISIWENIFLVTVSSLFIQYSSYYHFWCLLKWLMGILLHRDRIDRINPWFQTQCFRVKKPIKTGVGNLSRLFVVWQFSLLRSGFVHWKLDMTILSKLKVLFPCGMKVPVSGLQSKHLSKTVYKGRHFQ